MFILNEKSSEQKVKKVTFSVEFRNVLIYVNYQACLGLEPALAI
jgi:hypothetical protein